MLDGFTGGFRVGGRETSNLRCAEIADDIVLFATSLEELNTLINRLADAGKYLPCELMPRIPNNVTVDIVVDGKTQDYDLHVRRPNWLITNDCNCRKMSDAALGKPTAYCVVLIDYGDPIKSYLLPTRDFSQPSFGLLPLTIAKAGLLRNYSEVFSLLRWWLIVKSSECLETQKHKIVGCLKTSKMKQSFSSAFNGRSWCIMVTYIGLKETH